MEEERGNHPLIPLNSRSFSAVFFCVEPAWCWCPGDLHSASSIDCGIRTRQVR